MMKLALTVFLFAAVLGTSTAADCEALDLVGNDTVIVGDLYECLKEKYVKGQCEDLTPQCVRLVKDGECKEKENRRKMGKMCRASCRWCRGYCRRAPKIKGEGKIVGDEQIVFKKGEVVKVECDEGYTASNGVTESTCDGKKFSPRKIKCKKNKEAAVAGECRRPKASKGKLSPKKKRYAPGETVTIECKDGYEADGAAETVCEDGKFTNPKLKCKEVEEGEEDKEGEEESKEGDEDEENDVEGKEEEGEDEKDETDEAGGPDEPDEADEPDEPDED